MNNHPERWPRRCRVASRTRAVFGAAALVTSAAAINTITPPLAGAAAGTMQWSCEGASDDTGAVVADGLNTTTQTALSVAGITVQPSSFDYSITDLPAAVSVGSAPLAIDATIAFPDAANAQLAQGFAQFFGLSQVPFNPQLVGIVNAGSSPLTGLANSTSGVLNFSSTGTAAHVLAGTLNPNQLGPNELRLHQRITFAIDQAITFDGRSVQVNTLTFVCTSDPLATVWVVNPGAPIARDDTAEVTIVGQDPPALGGPHMVDVLANDEPSDATKPIDAASLSVVSASPGLTVEVVNGGLAVTGVPAPSEYNNESWCVSWTVSATLVSTDASGNATYDLTDEQGCQGQVVYRVCTVAPAACSEATATVFGSGTRSYQAVFPPGTFPGVVAAGGAAEGPAPSTEYLGAGLEDLYGRAPDSPGDLGPAVPAPMAPNYTG